VPPEQPVQHLEPLQCNADARRGVVQNKLTDRLANACALLSLALSLSVSPG
jgi:hypothetical protein